MMKEMKRVLSMVLCLVMILGMMPMVALNASAAEGTDDESIAEGKYTVNTKTEKTVYVRATGNPSGTVLIADRQTAGAVNMVANNDGSLANVTSTVVVADVDGDGNNDTYFELSAEDAEKAKWTVETGYKFENNGKYLHREGGKLVVSNNSTNWTYSYNRLYRDNRYLRYNASGNGWGDLTKKWDNATTIYFYAPKPITVGSETEMEGTFKIVATSPVYAAVQKNEDGSCDSYKDLPIEVFFTPVDGEQMKVTDFDYIDCEVIGGDAGIIKEAGGGSVSFTGEIGTAKVRVTYTSPDGETTVSTVVDVVTTPPYYSLDLINGETKEDLDHVVPIKSVENGASYPLWAVIKAHDGFIDTENGETEDGKDIGDVQDSLIKWSSSDETIAYIDEATGEITFTGNEGIVTITATYKKDGCLDMNGDQPTDSVTFSATHTKYMIPADGTQDFPEYPNEGAIRFDKTATAVGNFSQTGIAQLELSMTGVPYTTGNELDVVLMLDRSSSMYKSGVQHRISSTVEATKAFIEGIVKNPDGTFNSNRILVLDFLGGNLAEGSRHKFQSNQYTTDEDNGYQVINNQAELDALLNKVETDFKGQTSLYGTEYAQGLELCYEALKASKADGNQQFCVFMSDGIPNYMMGEKTHFTTTSSIVGRFTGNSGSNTPNMSRGTNYEYEYYSTQMKNDGVTVYSVGLGLKNTNSAWGGATAAACEQVADMLLNDISGPAYEKTEDRDTGKAVTKLDKYFFSVADDNAAANMKAVFSGIAQKILQAAKDVTVEDQIAPEYTMIFDIPEGSKDITGVTNDFYIEFLQYKLDENNERDTATSITKLYLQNNNDVLSAKDATAPVFAQKTLGQNGSLYYWSTNASDGDSDISVEVNGTTYYFVSYGMKKAGYNMTSGAYAHGTVDPTTNLSEDLVIATPYFVYNAQTKMLYWTVEKLDTFEYALRYFLYLDNSATEVGTNKETAAGPYPTNDHAYITYTNFLGNDCRQEFPKPQLTWNGAQVSYVFYLVNAKGEPVNKYGQVVDFANAIFVTDIYTESVVWNKEGDTSTGKGDLSADWLADSLLPDNYTIYDPQAHYLLNVFENADGTTIKNQFTISGGTATAIANHLSESLINVNMSAADVNLKTTKVYNTKSGTKVDGYGDYDTNNLTSINFANTTVAFAVVWQVALVPDAVVVDYGLDVLINAVQNDFLQNVVSGIGTAEDINTDAAINVGHYENPMFGDNDEVVINGHTISREPDKENMIRFHQGSMIFDEAIEFYYESPVKFYENSGWKEQYMYSSVTVIPATNIYYEDDFMNFVSYSKETGTWVQDDPENTQWVTAEQSGTQAQDRPGASQISGALDADNNYGYDAAYGNMSTHSMGSGAKITVDANNYGEATFTFWGTGFDLVSVTSGATGTITVLVKDAQGNKVRNTVVDTYYGMDAAGNVSPNTPDAIYQVPVIKIFDLPYGQYTVKVTAAYNSIFDHDKTAASYDLYLDAVRIYDPAGDTYGEDGNIDQTTQDAYIADGEAYPVYEELRNKIIAAGNYIVTDNKDGTLTVTATDSSADLAGAIFIDCADATTSMADYISYGPNNEVYLANNQAVAFNVNVTANVADVQLGIKVANGQSVTYEINGDTYTVNSATEMYYSIMKYAKNGVVTIKNVSGGILSLTNIKMTHKAEPGTEGVQVLKAMAPETVGAVLMSLRKTPVVEEEVPETTVPETTVPEETEPEVPETTVPEETEPKFEPTVKVKIKKPTVKKGKKVHVEIRTSSDVALITVNGTAVTKYKSDRKTGERTWTVSLTAKEAGEMEIEVIAYSEDGEAAEAVTETVKVTGKPEKKGKGKKR